MKGSDESEKAGNRVPIWDGKPETFHHYIQEVKWYFAATKTTDRPYAAARLIRRMLDSDYPALKTLMYKLEPSEFTDENGIQKLIAFLESSPMNRQPIPDAGAKLSLYYRKLSRRHGESIPQFLVREDHAHDGMWRALQRLLREKALDFTKYDTDEAELRVFCGMGPDQSFYIPEQMAEDDHEEEEDRASRKSATTVSPGSHQGSRKSSHEQSASRSSAPPSKPSPKKKDLIERLMDKGLIPLAALDIIRGWMVLEMTSNTDVDKALVKASTQNKLGYDAIRTALLTLHEDRDRYPHAKGKGSSRSIYAAWADDMDMTYGYDDWENEYDQYQTEAWNVDSGWQQGYYQEEEWAEEPEVAENDEEDGGEQDPEKAALLAQLQEEQDGLQAMMVDNQRNLQQARQAVAQSRRERGWHPPNAGARGSTSKPTSTYMKGQNGKGKGKNPERQGWHIAIASHVGFQEFSQRESEIFWQMPVWKKQLVS